MDAAGCEHGLDDALIGDRHGLFHLGRPETNWANGLTTVGRTPCAPIGVPSALVLFQTNSTPRNVSPHAAMQRMATSNFWDWWPTGRAPHEEQAIPHRETGDLLLGHQRVVLGRGGPLGP